MAGESIRRYLHLIDVRYPSQLDAGLNYALQSLCDTSQSQGKRSKKKRQNSTSKRDTVGGRNDEASTLTPEDQLFDFISLTFKVPTHLAVSGKVGEVVTPYISQGTSHQMLQESSTTLYLALQHPDEHLRLRAVEKVVAQLIEGSLDDEQFEEFIKDALLERLVDDSAHVVARVFQIADILLDKIEPEALFKQLSNIITRMAFSPCFIFLHLMLAAFFSQRRGSERLSRQKLSQS